MLAEIARGLKIAQDLPHGYSRRLLDVGTLCNYTDLVEFEWDEGKRRSNIKKHGIDFADLELLFDGVTLTSPDDRALHEEERFVTVGLLNGIVLVVVHTERARRIRIISARKATKYEEKSFFEKIAH